MIASTAISTRSMPNRRASAGASGASSPKQISGTVVSRAPAAEDRCRDARIWASTGPTEATAGRRLTAMSATATGSAHRVRVRAGLSRSSTDHL